MSKQFTRTPKCADPGVQMVWCTFYPAAAGAPTGLIGKGVASVVRTSQGLFTLTLTDGSYTRLLAKFGQVQMAAPTDVVAQVGVYVAGSTATNTPATITVTALAAAVATDIAANANNSVSVMLIFQRTEIPS